MGNLGRVLLVVLIVLVVVGSVVSTAKYTCEAKWKDSGHKSQYGVMSGCRVQRLDGTWMPSENMRDISAP